MKLTLHSYSIHRHPATTRKPAYAHILIRGHHQGILRKTWKSESYDIPLTSGNQGNKALVQEAMQRSANKWHIPFGMNFQ